MRLRRFARRLVNALALLCLAGPAPSQQFKSERILPECDVPEELQTIETSWKRPTAVAENFRQWYSFAGGGSVVRIGRKERADANSQWESEVLVYSTDMKITDVTFCGGGSDFYVAGIRATSTSCEDVIERWHLELPAGAYEFACPPPQPRGTSMPTPFKDQLLTVVVGGGPFVPVSQRGSRQPRVSKSVLYAGSAGVISAIEADPEGRFLLAQSHQTRDVYSIDLASPEADPILELSAAQYPVLLSLQNIVAYEHSTEGRVYEVSGGSKHIGVKVLGEKYCFLVDSDNDGLFEEFEVMDTAEYVASDYDSGDHYISLVNTGVDTP